MTGAPTLADEGAERERLGGAPVDALARLNHGAPLVVHALHALVQVEVLRDLGDRIAHLPQEDMVSRPSFCLSLRACGHSAEHLDFST